MAELFSELAEDLLAIPGVSRSTMMGFPCLRSHGVFFACVERGTGRLVVKLSEDRVDELVAVGRAQPFAPNGRTFRMWAAVVGKDRDVWCGLLQEARAYADF